MKRPNKKAIACINCRHYAHDHPNIAGRTRLSGSIAPCRWVGEIVMPKYLEQRLAFYGDVRRVSNYMEPYPVHDCKTFELIATDKPAMPEGQP